MAGQSQKSLRTNGIEVCRRIKANPVTSDVLVLQTSAALTGRDDKIRGLEGGAGNYLAAPIEADELVANVRALLRLQQTRADLQSIGNLLHNAAKFTSPNGKVRLVVQAMDDATVRISVQDNGIGITAQTIILVDDNVDSAEMMRDLLEALGHQVRLAHDGESALALAGARAPEVMILDIGLPDMDGSELARPLRAMPALAATRLIAHTGSGAPHDREKTSAAGFGDEVA